MFCSNDDVTSYGARCKYCFSNELPGGGQEQITVSGLYFSERIPGIGTGLLRDAQLLQKADCNPGLDDTGQEVAHSFSCII